MRVGHIRGHVALVHIRYHSQLGCRQSARYGLLLLNRLEYVTVCGAYSQAPLRFATADGRIDRAVRLAVDQSTCAILIPVFCLTTKDVSGRCSVDI